MHKCYYEDRIEIVDNKITRIVTAFFKEQSEDVYMETENDDEQYCRYIGYSSYCGYGVYFPGEKLGGYYGYGTAGEEEFSGCTVIPLRAANPVTEEDAEVIYSKYPDFRYVLKKWNPGTRTYLMKALKVWKKHKEVEMLLAGNLTQLAFSKAFYRLTDRKRKSVISYVKDKLPEIKASLANYSEVMVLVKNNIPRENIVTYCYMRSNMKDADKRTMDYILKKHNSPQEARLYIDYLGMLKNSVHNINDDYWLYPKDLREKHNRLLEEKRTKEGEQKKEKVRKYKKTVKKYQKYNTVNFHGYSIYIPDSIEDISFQADYLHQCLMVCDYPGQVINKRCVLVFIRKDNIPIATAQLMPDRKIGQFYADEQDRKNCHPTKEVTELFNVWLSQSGIYKEKKCETV